LCQYTENPANLLLTVPLSHPKVSNPPIVLQPKQVVLKNSFKNSNLPIFTNPISGVASEMAVFVPLAALAEFGLVVPIDLPQTRDPQLHPGVRIKTTPIMLDLIFSGSAGEQVVPSSPRVISPTRLFAPATALALPAPTSVPARALLFVGVNAAAL